MAHQIASTCDSMTATRRWVLASVAFVAVSTAFAAAAAEPIPVLILDGESGGPYHDWRKVTDVLEFVLDEVGLFEVSVATAPPAGGNFDEFAPDFSAYAAVVLNYDAPDGRWPESLQASLESYVAAGGGLVSVHAADNAFPGWRAYNEMLGVGGWRARDERAGPYWYFRNDALVADSTPGPAGSHGQRVPFAVVVREPTHPIMQGLPAVWMHGDDELYAHLRGPGSRMQVLATAYSDPANAGSGRDEPQLMVLDYGKGRVFHTTFGHDVRALSSTDFAVTLQRGVEWTATGAVTQAAPAAFPSATAPSYRADIAAIAQ
jgi:type 1 glutamine amidotransferase